MAAQVARGRIFISYSRADQFAAERLRGALNDRGFEAYLDLHDIAPAEDWRDRLGKLIASAEKILFLISPDSVASKICDWEINHAEKLGKPVIPVVVRETPMEDVPERLSRLNFIQSRVDAEWVVALNSIEAALTNDLAWEREKTRINELAQLWEHAGKPSRRLLSADDAIREAENWRDATPPAAPAPTELQRIFISASRRRFMRRQRSLMTLALMTAAITASLATMAYFQSEEAKRQRAEAQRQSVIATEQRDRAEENATIAERERDEALRAQSNFLSRASDDERDRGAIANAIALARAALPQDAAAPDRPVVPRAATSLTRALSSPRRLLATRRGEENMLLHGFRHPTEPLFYELPSGKGQGGRIWRLDTLEPGPALEGIGNGFHKGILSPDHRRLVTWNLQGDVRIWDAMTGAPGPQRRVEGGLLRGVSFAPNGQRLLTTLRSDTQTIAQIWNAENLELLFDYALPTVEPEVQPRPTEAELAGYNFPRDFVIDHLDAYEADAVAFNPDGTRLLAHISARGKEPDAHWRLGDAYRSVILLDTETGDIVQTLTGPNNFITSARFLNDGARVASLDQDRVMFVWDTARGETLWRARGVDEFFDERPDGRLVVRRGEEIAVLAGATGETLATIEAPDLWRIENAKGETPFLTIHTDNVLRSWDLTSGALIAEFKGHEEAVIEWRFDSTGQRLLTSAFDGYIRLWDARTGQSLAIMKGHEGPVVSARFFADDRKIVSFSGYFSSQRGRETVQGSGDLSIRVWDATSGAPVTVIEAERDHVDQAETPLGAVYFNLEEQTAVRVNFTSRALSLWSLGDPEPGFVVEETVPQVDHTETDTSGQYVLTMTAKAFEERRVPIDATSIFSVLVSSNMPVVGARIGGVSEFAVTHVATGEQVMLVNVEKEGLSQKGLRKINFGKHYAEVIGILGTGELVVWQLRDGSVERIPFVNAKSSNAPEPGGYEAFWIDARNRYLVTHRDSVEVWDLAERRMVTEIAPGADRIALSGNGDRIATATDAEITIWRTADGARVTQLPAPTGLYALTLNDEGTQLALLGAGSLSMSQWVTLVDLETGETAELTGETNGGLDNIFAHDAFFGPEPGQYFIQYLDAGYMRALEPETWTPSFGSPLYHYTQSVATVTRPQFTADRMHFLSVDERGVVTVYDLRKRETVVVIETDVPPRGAVFSKDGAAVLYWGQDGVLRRYPVGIDISLQIADGLLDRLNPLSIAEKCKYFLVPEAECPVLD